MRTCGTLAMPMILLAVSCTSIDDSAEHIGTLNLRLEFDLGMDMNGPVNSANSMWSGDGKTYNLRYTVEAYRKNENDVIDVTPVRRLVFTGENIFNPDTELNISLEDGCYEFFVWTDFVEAGTAADYFYDTGNLREIKLLGKHKGNNDFKDAFFGSVKVNVSGGQGTAAKDCGISMKRAVSKCEYYAFELSSLLNEISADGENPEECTATVFYTGRIPSGFNALTGETCMTRSGAEFSKSVRLDADMRMTNIGFDYMFSDEEDSSVSVLVGIFDKHGRLLTTTTHMNIPVSRNLCSSVNCSFITPVTIR